MISYWYVFVRLFLSFRNSLSHHLSFYYLIFLYSFINKFIHFHILIFYLFFHFALYKIFIHLIIYHFIQPFSSLSLLTCSNNPYFSSQNKCYPYWPTDPDKPLLLDCYQGNMEVRLMKTCNQHKEFIIRTFHLYCKGVSWGWMSGGMAERINGCLGGWVCGWVSESVDWWMSGWLAGWISGWKGKERFWEFIN